MHQYCFISKCLKKGPSLAFFNESSLRSTNGSKLLNEVDQLLVNKFDRFQKPIQSRVLLMIFPTRPKWGKRSKNTTGLVELISQPNLTKPNLT